MNNETKMMQKLSIALGLPQDQESIDKRKNRLYKPLATVAIGLSLFAIGESVFGEPEYSESTHMYVAQSGDGLYSAAESIKGIENIDIRAAVDHIANDPRNEKALSDGLQMGEALVVPDSAK
jgi:hypothetical protein